MILHKQGRFHIGAFSFIFPDSIYLNPMPPLESENGLELCDPDVGLTVSILGQESDCDSRKALEELLETFHAMSEIQPVQIQNLSGHRMLYFLTDTAYCEYRFTLPEDAGEPNALSIVAFLQGEPADAERILEHPAFQALINSLRRA